MSDNRQGHPLLIIMTAVTIVAIVSMLPLSRISGGKLNDFNLLGDLFPSSVNDSVPIADNTIVVDKELLAAIENEKNAALLDTVTASGTSVATIPSYGDSITAATSPELTVQVVIPEAISPRQNGIVKLEHYTSDGTGLSHIKAALAASGERLVRIAVLGDSYIEGDIFTQNVREQLQDIYGGSGVGYVNMYSEFPGFRRSVRQSGSGWSVYNINNQDCNHSYLSISEQYSRKSVEAAKARATYKGVDKLRHLSSWDVSRFLFMSPDASVITTVTTDDASDRNEIEGSPDVQCIEEYGETAKFSVSITDSPITAIGVWLDGYNGVSVDCMSSRGYSGVTLSRVNSTLCSQMRRYIDYDLIVLEFGINAMSASQSDYTAYSNLMVKVIAHLRQCYPKADILLMGIGDRGQKTGGDIRSMAVAQSMVDAQRMAARKAGCVFWDTREAMGGEGAIIKWASAQPPLANKDYVHLSHAGGAALAKEFVKSFLDAINN